MERKESKRFTFAAGQSQKKQDLLEILLFLVIPTRFERVTHSLEGCCSIQLSYGTILNGTAKLVIFPLIANVTALLNKAGKVSGKEHVGHKVANYGGHKYAYESRHHEAVV